MKVVKIKVSGVPLERPVSSSRREQSNEDDDDERLGNFSGVVCFTKK